MKKKPLIIGVAVIFILILSGFIIFAPTIFQEGNPLPIMQGIFRLQTSNNDIVSVSENPETYITKTENADSTFIEFMKNKGWTFKEQFGAGYLFEKQDKSITVGSKQYSRHFKLWTIQQEVNLDNKDINLGENNSEKEKAYKVVEDYFNAFSKADYETMRTLATDRHNENLIHEGDVWGMKWAKAKEIKFSETFPLTNVSMDSTLVFGVSVDMETVKTSALYPSNQTFFYIVLTKDQKGNWLVDSYTTG